MFSRNQIIIKWVFRLAHLMIILFRLPMYIYIHICIHACIYICVCIYEYTYIYKYMCVYIHIFVYICIFINTYTYIYKYMCVYIHICIYIETIGYWPLAIGSAISCQLLVIGYQLLAISYWLLAISCCLLAVGYRLLAISYWLVATSYQLVASIVPTYGAAYIACIQYEAHDQAQAELTLPGPDGTVGRYVRILTNIDQILTKKHTKK